MNAPFPPPQSRNPAMDASPLRAHYQSLLHALCDGHAIEPAVVAEIVERQSCVIEDVDLEFHLNEESGEVELFLDLGQPERAREPMFYRRLLEIQLQQGISPFWVLGAHPVSGHGVMLSQFLMTETADDFENFQLFLQVCVNVAKTLRAQLG